MSTNDVWAKLCDEFASADKEATEAWQVVTKKFGDIANGRSKINPTDDEIKRHTDAYRNRDRIKEEMNEYIRVNFGG